MAFKFQLFTVLKQIKFRFLFFISETAMNKGVTANRFFFIVTVIRRFYFKIQINFKIYFLFLLTINLLKSIITV
jgi:hypothetical protein